MHFQTTPHGSDAYEQALRLREIVLRIPLGLAFTEAEAEQDRQNIQVVGLIDGRVCATAVLAPGNPKFEGMKMQRVAVDEDHRCQGFGTKMTSFCEQVARDHGYPHIYAHARGTVVPFYLKNGYTLQGDPFIEQTIPHQAVSKTLNPG